MSWTDERIDESTAELGALWSQMDDLKKRASVIVNDLNKHGAAQRFGARSMVEWLVSRLDMSRHNASELVYAARFGHHRDIQRRLVEGEISFDRAMASLRLAEAGATDTTVAQSYQLDLNQVSRLASRQLRLGRGDEHRSFADRFFSIQPTLDESSWRLTGQLPGLEGRVVEKALHDRGEEFRSLPAGDTSSRAQRQADALVSMAQDSLDRDAETSTSTGHSVSVFIDLDRANGTGGELGAEVGYGPRVGPNTLSELLCVGSVQVVGLADGRPVVTSDSTKAIPPAVRSHVAHRDGACTIDGCTSRYRLQPHHIRERGHGGSHDPDNLTTLCWFHHRVAIHGQGFRIDPDSPPQRRRLVRCRAGPDPP